MVANVLLLDTDECIDHFEKKLDHVVGRDKAMENPLENQFKYAARWRKGVCI